MTSANVALEVGLDLYDLSEYGEGINTHLLQNISCSTDLRRSVYLGCIIARLLQSYIITLGVSRTGVTFDIKDPSWGSQDLVLEICPSILEESEPAVVVQRRNFGRVGACYDQSGVDPIVFIGCLFFTETTQSDSFFHLTFPSPCYWVLFYWAVLCSC